MRKIVLTALMVFFTLSGVILAQQSADEKKGSSMQEMMQQMMKEKQNGEGGMGDMKGMMKMMGRCPK